MDWLVDWMTYIESEKRKNIRSMLMDHTGVASREIVVDSTAFSVVVPLAAVVEATVVDAAKSSKSTVMLSGRNSPLELEDGVLAEENMGRSPSSTTSWAVEALPADPFPARLALTSGTTSGTTSETNGDRPPATARMVALVTVSLRGEVLASIATTPVAAGTDFSHLVLGLGGGGMLEDLRLILLDFVFLISSEADVWLSAASE